LWRDLAVKLTPRNRIPHEGEPASKRRIAGTVVSEVAHTHEGINVDPIPLGESLSIGTDINVLPDMNDARLGKHLPKESGRMVSTFQEHDIRRPHLTTADGLELFVLRIRADELDPSVHEGLWADAYQLYAMAKLDEMCSVPEHLHLRAADAGLGNRGKRQSLVEGRVPSPPQKNG
jgi:hypothetical protein